MEPVRFDDVIKLYDYLQNLNENKRLECVKRHTYVMDISLGVDFSVNLFMIIKILPEKDRIELAKQYERLIVGANPTVCRDMLELLPENYRLNYALKNFSSQIIAALLMPIHDDILAWTRHYLFVHREFNPFLELFSDFWILTTFALELLKNRIPPIIKDDPVHLELQLLLYDRVIKCNAPVPIKPIPSRKLLTFMPKEELIAWVSELRERAEKDSKHSRRLCFFEEKNPEESYVRLHATPERAEKILKQHEELRRRFS